MFVIFLVCYDTSGDLLIVCFVDLFVRYDTPESPVLLTWHEGFTPGVLLYNMQQSNEVIGLVMTYYQLN